MYLSELHAAQGGAQNGPSQIALVGHKYAVQRISSDLDDVAAEGVHDVHQIRVVAVDDLQKIKYDGKALHAPELWPDSRLLRLGRKQYVLRFGNEQHVLRFGHKQRTRLDRDEVASERVDYVNRI